MILLWVAFYLGWLVHLLAQCDRSLRARSNGLVYGFRGAKEWLHLQAVPTLVKGWSSTVYFGLHHAYIAPHVTQILPLNVFTASLMGFVLDELLDKGLVSLFPGEWPKGLQIDVASLVPPLRRPPDHPDHSPDTR